MVVSVELIKELRHMTSASVAHCREALEESKGDLKKAAEILKKKGLEIAAKKGSRVAKEGRVEAYVHMGNKIGVLLEINSESDFVARNPEFTQFARDVAMQIAAANPAYLTREEIPAEKLEQEHNKELFFKEHCLLDQPFVKDSGVTVRELLGALVGKMGENIVIRRFIRYKIGE
jgi:elongation factor Ts